LEDQSTHSCLLSISEKEILHPNNKIKKPSLSTLKRKLKIFNADGFDGLNRKSRNDRGKPRKHTKELIEHAVEYKKDLPSRSAYTINLFLQENHAENIPESTLYRYFKDRNVTRAKLGLVKKKVRGRWTRNTPNDLWVGDFQNGPYVLEGDTVKETYLSLFIDCHSRYVVYGAYYLRTSLDVLIDTLLKAFCMNGLCNELYLDNAKVYHANALKQACYDLSINLLHRKVRDPAPGGLVERLFLSGQMQFETEVRAGDILTLDELNRSFTSWLDIAYHDRVHSELKKKPVDAYALVKKRLADADAILRFFMTRKERRVNKVFSDVSIDSIYYQVDKRYRGDKVNVHYDPFSDRSEVLLYNLKNEYLQKAIRYEREVNFDEPTPEPEQKPKHSYLDLINKKHDKKMQADINQTDFTQVDEVWPLTAFISHVAVLVGYQGNHHFTTEELTLLKQAYDRHSNLNAGVVTSAFEQADVKNIRHLILHLQH
jgi:transposase InsO family protein